jgi:glycine/D-amino acid oxidase-like deaminating enzyme
MSESYWQATAPRMALATKLPGLTDVAVIGGGIHGSSITYWLARAGVQVVQIERVAPAFGATGRNAGFVVAGPGEAYPDMIERVGRERARAAVKLAYENQPLLQLVLAEEGIECEYQEAGNLALALNMEQRDFLQQEIDALQEDDFPAQWVGRAQLEDLIPTQLSEEIVGARLFPLQGKVHSAKLVQGVMEAAQRYGALTCVAEVQQIEQEGETVHIRTSEGMLRAGSVVIAVNAWSGDLIPAVADLIVPVRGQMLAYAPIAPTFRHTIGTSITATGEYWQQRPDGSLLVGGCRALAPNQDRGVREAEPTEVVQHGIEQILPRFFPALLPLHIVRRWAGLMAFTPDYLPIADCVPDMPNAWFIGGFSGHGMPLSMRCGQLLAEAALSGNKPDALWPFSLDRETLKL